MSTIKLKREELAAQIDHLSALLSAKGDDSIKTVLTVVEAYAQPNGAVCDGAYDTLVNIESALRSVIGGIEALTTVRAGESGGFINGINKDSGTCRIVHDSELGYRIIGLAEFEAEFDSLFIDREEA